MDRPTDELSDQLKAVLEAGISDEAMKPIKKKVEDICRDIEDDVFYRAKDALAYNLSVYAADMAKRTVEAMLAGNESEIRRYLMCDANWNGRLDRHVDVIHGRLFETNAIDLRRKIVEAHRDLISNERILDLETQLRVLLERYNKLHQEFETYRERYRP